MRGAPAGGCWWWRFPSGLSSSAADLSFPARPPAHTHTHHTHPQTHHLSSLTSFPSRRCPHLRPMSPQRIRGRSTARRPARAKPFTASSRSPRRAKRPEAHLGFEPSPREDRCHEPGPNRQFGPAAAKRPFSFSGHLVKKVIFYRPVFVAAFPQAVIKNNNSDNSVPSTQQWSETSTSV